MIARRFVTALLLAGLISGSMTLWLSRRIKQASAATTATHVYVAASRDLEAGELLKSDNLVMLQWPASVPVEGGFTKVDEVIGRSVMYPISKSEPLLNRQLVAAGSGVGLAAKIPQGMRAISMRSDEVVGVAGFLLPGTHVDVLVTYRTTNAADPATATVVQDAEVLAAGQKLQPDPDGKPSTVNVVTLLLDPANAEKAVLASTQGTVHFVLRNGADRVQADTRPITISQLVTAPAPTGSAPKATHIKEGPKPYTVETLLGDKKLLASFN